MTVEFNYWLAIFSCTMQLKSSLEQLKQQFKKINEWISTCTALKTRNIIFGGQCMWRHVLAFWKVNNSNDDRHVAPFDKYD